MPSIIGYLTYMLATLAMVGAVAGYLLGILDAGQALTQFWAGATAFGLHRAVATNGAGHQRL
jgi:hypothetical protein